ncbi:hypothetical protein GLAREA_05013 [Glarea lozoyensis ATCC 20868]|uniref:Heterokaryon incompatibility domain-containing protein n=1 Tax=Glarea lozoyensis (strain ATCC 20868 / MF5171) TaxID=1116229 RepID=S3DUP2_GLAL2|nr:uncharacterized protein GLAREA_05013 [Glarea lozoyensis ATCC 20868]EPE35676.1 hypothetical protein GLAREA_05013 [Glarea lozoyensis ATCC 20868]
MAYSVLKAQYIRVLILEPSAQDDSVITCSLAPLSLSEIARPQYEALSYVWGEAAERNEILLDGKLTSITRNLWTALKYIRQTDASRTLWIDAICINQNDINERNEQVRQMGRIYSQASCVLIWLGPPDAEIENTMLALQIEGALEGRQYEQFPKDIALGLQRILSRPWWHRIWVIQEHVLANADAIVGCGHTWLGWTQLSSALLDYSRRKMDESGTFIHDASSTWVADPFAIIRHVSLRKQWNDKDNSSETSRTLADIVERTRGYQATDKRDQVFAIRDLLREEDKERFPAPNYARSASEVYQEATIAFIQSSKNLAFLLHAVEKDDVELGLPSWCVDFSKRLWDWGTYGNVGGYDLGGCDESEGTRNYMSVLSHNISVGTLKVLGGVLGQVIMSRPLIPPSAWDQSQITFVGDGQPHPSIEVKARNLWVVTQLIKEVLYQSAISFKIWERQHGVQTAKERLAAGEVWEIVFGGGILFNIVDAVCAHAGIEQVDGDDRPYEYWVIEAFVRMAYPWYTDTIVKMGFLYPTPELPDSPRLRRALWETLMLMTQVSNDKWWFGTETGYVGRVEREVKEGDQLCTIFGCRQPLVLRPCDGGSQLIAVPYSKDFNDQSRKSEVKREVFTLR